MESFRDRPQAGGADASRARGLLAVLAFLPALLTGLLVAAHAENVPVWDDFERVSLLASFAEGTLGFRDLYATHIDHRIVVPRLLILANAVASGGSLVWENAISFAIVFATALALAGLLRRTLPEASGAALGALLVVNLLVFSPLQFENFLWAIQTAFVLPMACLAVALLALETRLSLWARFGLAVGAAVVGTYSFSHGLLIWAAVPTWWVLRGLVGDAPANERRRFLLAWAVAMAAVLLPYFLLDYKATSSTAMHQYGVTVGGDTPMVASFSEALASPRLVARFYISMVGSPLARLGPWAPLSAAPYWGAAVHALLAVVLAAFVVARDRVLWRRSLPWWVFAGTALIACALAAVGRVLLTDVRYALAPRYVSVSQYVLVALVALGALLWVRAPRARAGVLGVAVVFVLSIIAGWRTGIDGMRSWQDARLQARTSLLFIQEFEPRFIRRLDHNPETARRSAEVLDRYGYLDPPLARASRPDAFEVVSADPDRATGRITEAHPAGGRLVVRGEAALAEGRPAHGVLLTVGEGAERRAVGIGEGRARPRWPYLHDHLFGEVELDPDEPTGVWRTKVEIERLPDAPVVRIDAFVVDSGRLRLYPLAESISLVREDGGLQVRVLSTGDGAE